MNHKTTKYIYPAGASQSAKAKIRREARAAAKEASLGSSPRQVDSNFSVSFVGHDDQNEVIMIPEELAHKLLSIKNITKHFIFNEHSTGVPEEILSSFNGWSWNQNPPVEATDDEIAKDKAELDKLLNV